MKARSSLEQEKAGPQGHEHLRLLEATAAANIDGVTISDARQPDHPLVYVNPGFERMTGYSPEEALGRVEGIEGLTRRVYCQHAGVG